MPRAVINGINLSFSEYGSGEPVLLITGSGAKGSMWTPHQVPVLTAAGYRVIIFDNRGIAPSDLCPDGFTVADMVADTAGLIEFLGISPCRIVGFSLGAIIAQELLLTYPGLVTQAVLMATRGRTDALRAASVAADADLLDSGTVLPRRYAAVVHAMQFLSPRTQGDDRRIRDWLDVFEASLTDPSGHRAHHGLDLIDNRLEYYRKIKAKCMVIAFTDDLIAPPHLCREVSDCISGSKYEEVDGCGHYGIFEEPAAVNALIVKFFSDPDPGGLPGVFD